MQDGEEVVVLGSVPGLGDQQLENAVVLTETATPHWETEVSPKGVMLLSHASQKTFLH